MPGFIEMHSHMHISGDHENYEQLTTENDETLLIRASAAVRTALLSGVTTMRDLGAKNSISLAIRAACQQNLIPGPTMIIAGAPITTTGGHCHMFGIEVNTKDEVIKAVRDQFHAGVDWIKIMATGGNFTPGTNPKRPQYDLDILTAAVSDAHRLGMKIAAHCHATAGVEIAATAGVDNIVHCSWNAESAGELYDYKPDIADLIANNGIYVDPTLALNHLNELRGRKKPAPTLSNPTLRMEILHDMWERGIKFVTGMDSGMTNAYFGDFAFIPQVMVEKMGISEMDAILTSTKTSAECLGLSDTIGMIKPGMTADIVITDGNPLSDIKMLHNVDTILHLGKIVKKNYHNLV
jgi:imidazolonepropionase-like amidohydrolase